ncbi:MAG: hypothetical protein WAN46_11590 [Gammaproteobacteria bacterium]|jgi:hypothetical protein
MSEREISCFESAAEATESTPLVTFLSAGALGARRVRRIAGNKYNGTRAAHLDGKDAHSSGTLIQIGLDRCLPVLRTFCEEGR